MTSTDALTATASRHAPIVDTELESVADGGERATRELEVVCVGRPKRWLGRKALVLDQSVTLSVSFTWSDALEMAACKVALTVPSAHPITLAISE